MKPEKSVKVIGWAAVGNLHSSCRFKTNSCIVPTGVVEFGPFLKSAGWLCGETLSEKQLLAAPTLAQQGEFWSL